MLVLDLLIASLGSALAIVVLVVVLILSIYHNEVPQLAGQWPSLLLIAGLFAGIGASGWLAVWGRSRNKSFRHWLEIAMLGLSGLFTLAAVRLLAN